MAFITREFYDVLKENKIIEHGDFVKLERMSREVGLGRNQNGIVANTFRNAIVKGFTTTEEAIKLIHGYYKPKVDMIQKQRKVVQNMKQKLQNA